MELGALCARRGEDLRKTQKVFCSLPFVALAEEGLFPSSDFLAMWLVKADRSSLANPSVAVPQLITEAMVQCFVARHDDVRGKIGLRT